MSLGRVYTLFRLYVQLFLGSLSRDVLSGRRQVPTERFLTPEGSTLFITQSTLFIGLWWNYLLCGQVTPKSNPFLQRFSAFRVHSKISRTSHSYWKVQMLQMQLFQFLLSIPRQCSVAISTCLSNVQRIFSTVLDSATTMVVRKEHSRNVIKLYLNALALS